jgi:hypothetical protein
MVVGAGKSELIGNTKVIGNRTNSCCCCQEFSRISKLRWHNDINRHGHGTCLVVYSMIGRPMVRMLGVRSVIGACPVEEIMVCWLIGMVILRLMVVLEE